jgi:hypothetical protein
MVDTWASGGGPYTSIKMNATDNDAASASLLMDLQVGGASKFKLYKTGILCFDASSNGGAIRTNGTRLEAVAANASAYAPFQALDFRVGGSDDLLLTRRAAANLRLGNVDAAAPVAQTLSVQSVVAGTTNTAGTALTITGSQGTGNAAGGSIIFQVAPAGSSGSAQNALATALTINADRSITVAANASSLAQIAMADRGTILSIYASAFGQQPLIVNAPGGIAIENNTGAFRLGASQDVVLARDAANTLALRNGATAQTFRIYNTYTDGSNYARWQFVANSGPDLLIENDAAGSGGTSGNLILGTNAGGSVYLKTNTSNRWQVNSSGHFLAVADNTYDIGASGATRPRNVFVAGAVTVNGLVSTSTDFRAGSANYFYWNARSQMSSPADGLILLQNLAATDFGRLQFGGTTSSFPALKRNGTALETKLADDTAYAPHAMQYLDVTDGVTAPASATGRARIYVDTADGDLKVIFADGTVKTIVTDT